MEVGSAPVSPPGYWSPLEAESPPLPDIKEINTEMPVRANKNSSFTPGVSETQWGAEPPHPPSIQEVEESGMRQGS